MFRGEVSLSMDAKGRLAVPTRYRQRLSETGAGTLVVTISLMDKCLTVYPFSVWQRIEDQIRSLPSLDPQARSIRQLLIGHANECDMDGHGRILIPQSLRDFAGLDRKVSMIGQVDSFELWDEKLWTARREALLERVGSLDLSDAPALRDLVL